ncbi:phospho-sugar mutase [Scatolibacter rhodanostii]|uniref:phospho-sugar mutase n=1 Tax=Scatolibacter rhodanostii TaxID=2014781 RepID=UPI000C080358|nr:phospho-sugar mutase [Scatolibacter rhodanostii]
MTEYQRWMNQDLDDQSLIDELKEVEGQPDEINDRFYRDLAFGTGGLRGVIGAGTNRMNVYTVRKATQGLANYLLKHADGKPQSVAIAHDSRNKGVDFAKQSAAVLAANGITAYLYTELMPTPALSFAVRHLHCNAGICVTASHNPAKYNGYKAYGSDGCQVTSEMADGIMAEINTLDIFADVKKIDFDEGIKAGSIIYMDNEVADSFIEAVYNESLKGDASNIKVVYTPLNGSGKACVLRILDKIGVKDITVVPEQSEPDGNFPTCPYPNPEFREALQKGLELCETVQPDLLLATDPDCDRVGIAVKKDNDFVLVSGNEVGVLLLDFVARIKKEQGKLPQNPVAVTTIVSTDMVDPVAAKYGIDLRKVLTGFKYIGDVIAELEDENRVDDFIFGFEESYGYLSGGYVRDKDAVDGSMLICEMASYYKEKGITLYDAMQNLYKEHGYYANETLNFTFEGQDGVKKMDSIMDGLRQNPPKEIAGMTVTGHSDYLLSIRYENGETPITLPKSNVLEYRLAGGNKFMVRPSGTEPKIKIYLSVNAPSKEETKVLIDSLTAATEAVLGI